MAKVIEENATFLLMFQDKHVSLNQKKVLLKTITSGQFKALGTIIYNLLYSNIQIDSKLFTRLGLYKTTLRRVVNKSIPLHLRRKALNVQLVVLLVKIVKNLLKKF
jgi:hypothetical protein